VHKLFAAALLALIATASSAATVTPSSGAFTVTFNGIVDVGTPSVPTVMPGLTATADFNVTSWTYSGATNTTTLLFDITVDNTSDAAIWQSAVITALGFDTNPAALGGSSTGIFNSLSPSQSLPTGLGFTVAWCANNQPQGNCGGGTPDPLLGVTGAGGVAHVTMTFAGNLSSLDFTNFGLRWQALDSATLGIAGGSGIGVSTPPVPEPASMAVFGLGALLVGAALRNRAKS
jgi:hypothetical protein